MEADKIKQTVKKRYGDIAESDCGCGGCGCGTGSSKHIAKAAGYSDEEIHTTPESNLGLGCGNPTTLAEIKKGEIVLDLGSGAGFDCFLAAKKVGASGKVIGVDMTPEMIKKAQKNAEINGIKNVEFKLGEIENLPVNDNSVDLIISNCVINLSPDKQKAYQEAYRALKPGGRILISDIVTEGELPEEIRKNINAWAECVAGALQKAEYLETIRRAGFGDIEILSQSTFSKPGADNSLAGGLSSIQVRATK